MIRSATMFLFQMMLYFIDLKCVRIQDTIFTQDVLYSTVVKSGDQQGVTYK